MEIQLLDRARNMSVVLRRIAFVIVKGVRLWCTCFAALEAETLRCRNAALYWVGFPLSLVSGAAVVALCVVLLVLRNCCFAAFSMARKSQLQFVLPAMRSVCTDRRARAMYVCMKDIMNRSHGDVSSM